MVRVPAVCQIHVQIESAMGDEGLEEVFEEPEIEGFDLSIWHRHVVDEVGPAAEINCNLRQCFVERNRSKSKSLDPCLFAQGLMQGLAHDDANILHCMVFVDIDVALGLNRQIKETMFGQEFKHVVEEANPCVDLSLPTAIQRPFNTDIGFLRGSLNARLPWS